MDVHSNVCINVGDLGLNISFSLVVLFMGLHWAVKKYGQEAHVPPSEFVADFSRRFILSLFSSVGEKSNPTSSSFEERSLPPFSSPSSSFNRERTISPCFLSMKGDSYSVSTPTISSNILAVLSFSVMVFRRPEEATGFVSMKLGGQNTAFIIQSTYCSSTSIQSRFCTQI